MPPASLRGCAAAVLPLLRGAAYEALPTGALPAALPPGTRVYLPHLPHVPSSALLARAAAVQAAGLQPVSHVCPRHLPSRAAAESLLAGLAQEGIAEVLLVGGSAKSPHGPFDSVTDFLDAFDLSALGLRRVGIAAHPQGNAAAPALSLEDCRRLVAAKAERLTAQGLSPYAVTQFCFDPVAVVAEVAWMQSARLPVVLGVPGACSWPRLLFFTQLCGVPLPGPRAATHDGVLRHRPEALLGPVAEALGEQRLQNVVQGLLFFPFGAVQQTAAWVQRTIQTLEA
eukprot:EG_transcript_21734